MEILASVILQQNLIQHKHSRNLSKFHFIYLFVTSDIIFSLVLKFLRIDMYRSESEVLQIKDVSSFIKNKELNTMNMFQNIFI